MTQKTPALDVKALIDQSSDEEIVTLYREFSDEFYAAGFMGTSEYIVEHFLRWLPEREISEYVELMDYEVAMIALVRKAVEGDPL